MLDCYFTGNRSGALSNADNSSIHNIMKFLPFKCNMGKLTHFEKIE